MVTQALYIGFLLLLAGERMVELAISRRNAAWLLARGGIEEGQAHFRWMKLLHTLFLVGCAAEVLLLDRPFRPLLGGTMLLVALAAQGLRYWAIRVLGKRWNVRVIVLPGEPAVTRGPFRFVRHPNYLAVVLEGIAVPLVHGAWLVAGAFTLLNAILLVIRIRSEEAALAAHCQYVERLGSRRRFLPRLLDRAGAS